MTHQLLQIHPNNKRIFIGFNDSIAGKEMQCIISAGAKLLSSNL